MHSKNVLGTVIAVLIFMAPSFIFGQKSKGDPALSVKQEADLLLTNLKKNLKKSTSVEKRFEQLKKFKTDLTGLRKKNARQLEGDEVAMDTLVTALDLIPLPNIFKKKECSNYEQKILVEMSPQSYQGEKVEPSTQASLDVLALICK